MLYFLPLSSECFYVTIPGNLQCSGSWASFLWTTVRQSHFLHHFLVASHHTLGCCQPPTLDSLGSSVLFSSVPPHLAKEDSQQLNEVRKESKHCMKQALTYPACLQTVLTPSQFGNSPQKLWMLG